MPKVVIIMEVVGRLNALSDRGKSNKDFIDIANDRKLWISVPVVYEPFRRQKLIKSENGILEYGIWNMEFMIMIYLRNARRTRARI